MLTCFEFTDGTPNEGCTSRCGRRSSTISTPACVSSVDDADEELTRAGTDPVHGGALAVGGHGPDHHAVPVLLPAQDPPAFVVVCVSRVLNSPISFHSIPFPPFIRDRIFLPPPSFVPNIDAHRHLRQQNDRCHGHAYALHAGERFHHTVRTFICRHWGMRGCVAVNCMETPAPAYTSLSINSILMSPVAFSLITVGALSFVRTGFLRFTDPLMNSFINQWLKLPDSSLSLSLHFVIGKCTFVRCAANGKQD